MDTTEIDTKVGFTLVTTSDTEVTFPLEILAVLRFKSGVLETMGVSDGDLTGILVGLSILTGEEQPVKTCRVI